MNFPMSLEMMSLILVVTFLFLLLIGVEIFASIGLAACVGLLLFMHQSVDQFAYTAWATENTFTFTAPPGVAKLTLVLKQDGVGSRIPTWPGTVLWPGNVAPTLSTGAADVDIISFLPSF